MQVQSRYIKVSTGTERVHQKKKGLEQTTIGDHTVVIGLLTVLLEQPQPFPTKTCLLEGQSPYSVQTVISTDRLDDPKDFYRKLPLGPFRDKLVESSVIFQRHKSSINYKLGR